MSRRAILVPGLRSQGTAANTHEITTQAEDLERSARSLRDAMGHFRLA